MSTNESAVSAVPVRRAGAEDGAAPLFAHLAELRRSILVAAGAVVLCSLAASRFIDPLMADIARPVGRLYFLGPAEAFMTKLKVALFAGAVLGAPVVFYEAWQFVRRGLYPCERRTVLALTGVSLLLFLGGAAFCYGLVLPAGVRFLMSYGTSELVPFISATNYLSFVCRMVLSFGVVFELPLAMWFLVKAGVVRPATLRRNRRLAVVLIVLAAAVLTPTTDVFNQAMMAGPLVLLYEAGIVAARLSERKREEA
jgi:sec-independent protein translocase protein TatC